MVTRGRRKAETAVDDYEKWTDENVKARSEYFASLNFGQVASDLKQLSTTSSNRTHQVHPKTIEKDFTPRRSLRLKNKPPVTPNEEEIAATSTSAEIEPQYHAKRLEENIDLESCKRSAFTTNEDIKTFQSILHKVSDDSASSKDGDDSFAFGSMMNWKIELVSVSKVCRERALSLAVHPSSSKIIFAAGDLYGGVGLHCEDSPLNRCEFEPHTRPVTSLIFDSCHLLSSSYDGTLRCLDLERNELKFNLLYSADGDIGITCIDVPSDSCFSRGDLWISETNGNIVRLDGRIDSNKCAAGIFKVTNRTCRSVSVSPSKNLLCSASADGTVAFWDVRFLANEKSTHTKPLASLNHAGAVSSAYLNPSNPHIVLSTSRDNTVRLSSLEGSECKTLVSWSHNNNTGRFLTPFRAVWHPSAEYMFGIGSLLRPRRVKLFSASAKAFPRFNCKELLHDSLSSVQSLICFHRTLPLVVGVNSSGRTHAIYLKNDQL